MPKPAWFKVRVTILCDRNRCTSASLLPKKAISEPCPKTVHAVVGQVNNPHELAYRMMFVSSSSTSSPTVIARALAAKPRCATMRRVNSNATLTLDASS